MRVRLLLAFLVVLGLLGSVAQAERSSSKRDARADMRQMVVRNARLGAPAKAPPARSLASATGQDRRYALANGCYSLRSSAGYVGKDAAGYSAAVASIGGAEGFRMQATRLGSYLFYGRGRDFMAAGLLGAVAPAGGASPDADWQVNTGAGNTFTITLPSRNKALGVTAGRLVLTDPASAAAFAFEPAQGCAV